MQKVEGSAALERLQRSIGTPNDQEELPSDKLQNKAQIETSGIGNGYANPSTSLANEYWLTS